MVYVIAAIVLFGILIAVHELGHFLAAKLCGVRVYEYAIGMGPVLWKKRKGETEYSLRMLPIGGYCAMEGEDEVSDSATSLSKQSFWRKLVIYVAGAAMNLLTGFLILVLLYMPAKYLMGTQIMQLAPDFPQQGEQGLMLGDTVYAIDGERVYVSSDIGLLLEMLPRDEAGTLELTILRDGKKLHRTLELHDYVDAEGQSYRAYGFSYGGVVEATPMLRLRYAWNNTLDLARLVRLSLKMLVSGDVGIGNYSGPVGIISTIAEVGTETEKTDGKLAALENVLYIGAMIAVNLAVMNLLPIPALDGGKVFFLLVDTLCVALFRRKIPEKYEEYIHFGGFILLMGVMLLVTFSDIVKLF